MGMDVASANLLERHTVGDEHGGFGYQIGCMRSENRNTENGMVFTAAQQLYHAACFV